MKYFLVLIFFTVLSINTILAQDYTQAIGFRGGITSGLVYKHLIDDGNAIEAMVGYQKDGLQFSMVRQYYQPVLLGLTKQLFLFYGYGGRLGYYLWSNQEYLLDGEYYNRRQFSIGFAFKANMALEYHFVKFPVILSIDYNPYFEINIPMYFRRNYSNIALSLMFTF